MIKKSDINISDEGDVNDNKSLNEPEFADCPEASLAGVEEDVEHIRPSKADKPKE